MKRIRYTKYTGDPASEMSMEDMLKALSEYLLDSGFQDPWSRFAELDGEHTMDNLREALRQALEAGDLFDERDAAAHRADGRERRARPVNR